MVNPKYDRDWIAKALQVEGVPVRAGYVTPLHQLPAFRQEVDLPSTMVALDRLILLEMCAIDPTDAQLLGMRRAFEKVIEGAEQHGKKSS
jgi:dTDP-4-amino-4,6-dideoxygalactose transaminase